MSDAWTDNVRPITHEDQLRVLRVFHAIETCFRPPAWSAFEPAEPPRYTFTIDCERCGEAYSYRTGSKNGQRRFCDGCVRS